MDKRMYKKPKNHIVVRELAIKQLTFSTGLVFDEGGVLISQGTYSRNLRGYLASEKALIKKEMEVLVRELDVMHFRLRVAPLAKGLRPQTFLRDEHRVAKEKYRLLARNLLTIDKLLRSGI